MRLHMGARVDLSLVTLDPESVGARRTARESCDPVARAHSKSPRPPSDCLQIGQGGTPNRVCMHGKCKPREPRECGNRGKANLLFQPRTNSPRRSAVITRREAKMTS